MSRIFKCNRCGATFTTAPSYVMLIKGKVRTSTEPAVSTGWIDLCSSCTTAFLTWLHPNQNSVEERSADK